MHPLEVLIYVEATIKLEFLYLTLQLVMYKGFYILFKLKFVFTGALE